MATHCQFKNVQKFLAGKSQCDPRPVRASFLAFRFAGLKQTRSVVQNSKVISVVMLINGNGEYRQHFCNLPFMEYFPEGK